MQRLKGWTLVAVAALAVMLTVAPPVLSKPVKPLQMNAETALICRHLTAVAERHTGIPAQLLSAISLAESGHWWEERQERIAWPWTIYAEGRGRYFPTRQQAEAELTRLLAKGVRNIDVGCMQINLHYHGHVFASPLTALDPVENVGYSAHLLLQHREKTRSWIRAVGHYHSNTPDRSQAYSKRVRKFWNMERQRAMRDHRKSVRERHVMKRQDRLNKRLRPVHSLPLRR